MVNGTDRSDLSGKPLTGKAGPMVKGTGLTAGWSEGANWRPIEEAPTDYTEIIAMDAKGLVRMTWFFAPSSQTRNWLIVPGNRAWNPVLFLAGVGFDRAASIQERRAALAERGGAE